jgi:DNA repair protein RecO
MRNYFVTEGVIIKRQPYRENGILCRCLTMERGVISLIASGVYKERSNFSGVFEPFNRLQLHLYSSEKSELHNVKEGNLIESYLVGIPFNKNVVVSAAGELILQIDYAPGDSAAYYELLVNFCSFIRNTSHHPIAVFLRFVLRLFLYLGIPLSFSCAECDQKTIKSYSHKHHGFVCIRCEKKVVHDEYIDLSDQTRELLSGINDLNALSGDLVTKSVANELSEIILRHLGYCFDKRFYLRSLKSFNWQNRESS